MWPLSLLEVSHDVALLFKHVVCLFKFHLTLKNAKGNEKERGIGKHGDFCP